MNTKTSDGGTGASHPAKPPVEERGVKVVRPGPEEGLMPQGVLGLRAIS